MDLPAESVVRLDRQQLDSDEYRDFIRPLFGGDETSRRLEYLQWLLGKNPALEASDALPIFIYRTDEPLGQLAVIPVKAVFGGHPCTGGWCIDFFVGPKAQRRGLGSKLLAAAFKDFPLLLTLGQTDLAYQFFLKHGWYDGGCTQHYRTLLNPWKGVPKLVMRKLGLRSTSPSPALHTETRSDRKTPQSQRLTYGDLSTNIETHFTLPGERQPSFEPHSSSCYIEKSPEYLNWRFLEMPSACYQLTRISTSQGVSMVAALRFYLDGGWSKVLLADLIYPPECPPSELAIAIQTLLRYCRQKGAEQFECRTSDEALLKVLPSSRFSTCQSAERFLYATAAAMPRVEVPAEDWKLHAADCDVDALQAYQASLRD